MMEWIVSAADSGPALTFLARKLPTAPTGYLRQLLRKGNALRNLEPLTETDELQPDDRVSLKATARLRELLTAATGSVSVLYESREILIVEKPAGLATHRGKGHETDHLQGRIEKLMTSRKGRFSVAPVHRLDLETSGPVLFGKGRRAASRLGQLFMAGEVQKYYLALAAGEVSGNGRLTSTLLCKGKPKEAVTTYRTLAGHRELSLLELELHSGRTHQIRRQLAELGHPLIGDRRYGGPLAPELRRMFLHCRRLSLTNPFDGTPIVADSPLPEELIAFLRLYHSESLAVIS